MAQPYGQYGQQPPAWQAQGYQPPTYPAGGGVRTGEAHHVAYQGVVGGVTGATDTLGTELKNVEKTLASAQTKLVESLQRIGEEAIKKRDQAVVKVFKTAIEKLGKIQKGTTGIELVAMEKKELDALMALPGALAAISQALTQVDGAHNALIQQHNQLFQQYQDMEAYYQNELFGRDQHIQSLEQDLMDSRKAVAREISRATRFEKELKQAKGEFKEQKKETASLRKLQEVIEEFESQKAETEDERHVYLTQIQELNTQLQIMTDENVAYKLQLQDTEGVSKRQIELQNLRGLQKRFEEVCRAKKISDAELQKAQDRETKAVKIADKKLKEAQSRLENYQKELEAQNTCLADARLVLEKAEAESQEMVRALSDRVDEIEEELSKLKIELEGERKKTDTAQKLAKVAVWQLNYQEGTAVGFDSDSDQSDDDDETITEKLPVKKQHGSHQQKKIEPTFVRPHSVPVQYRGTPMVIGHGQTHTHTHTIIPILIYINILHLEE